MSTSNPAPEVRVPAGCFARGHQRNYADERPRRRICVARFRIHRTEVTVRDYARCRAAGKCTAARGFSARHPTRRRCNAGRAGFGPHPINCVTWAQARAYCAWRGMRLPSEAEWERAATGARPGPYPWGTAAPTCQLAVVARRRGTAWVPGCGTRTTGPTGKRPRDRSRFGVFDLAGNVSEWTADWFALGYYKRSPERQPRGPKRGRTRSVRGGNFRSVPGSRLLRRTARQFSATWDPTIGFRCVRGPRGQ